jgi:hypothetical protein
MKAFITRCFCEGEESGEVAVVMPGGEVVILDDSRGNVMVDFGAGVAGSLADGAELEALRAEFDAYRAAHP